MRWPGAAQVGSEAAEEEEEEEEEEEDVCASAEGRFVEALEGTAPVSSSAVDSGLKYSHTWFKKIENEPSQNFMSILNEQLKIL